MKKRGAILSVLFLLFVSGAAAQTGRNAAVKRIDSYVKTIESFTRKFKKPHLIFADTSNYNEKDKPKWRKFASEAALAKTETYTIAFNWRKNGKLVQTNFTLFSPSGDWAQYDLHYFRADGTIAKIASEMRTFDGDLIILQDFYFNEKGRLLRKTTRYRDLRSKKPIKKPKDHDYLPEVGVYKTVRRLPFARLLK